MLFKCYYCKSDITEQPKFYYCACGLKIWKEVSGKKLTDKSLGELLINGETSIIDGFTSRRTGKLFSAKLILQDKKVAFKFDGTDKPEMESRGERPAKSTDTVSIRVESGNSGSVSVFIGPPLSQRREVNFGLVSSRMAECLGCIMAVNLLKHYIKDVSRTKLELFINNLDFSRYILRERMPRNVELKSCVEYLWNALKDFSCWRCAFKPNRRPRLCGSPQAGTFPKGIFPGLNPEIFCEDTSVTVRLPDSPDVIAQFRASFTKAAEVKKGIFTLPIRSESAVKAWIKNVSGM